MSKLCIVLAKKKYRGVIFHETEGGYKIWREFGEESTCCFKIGIRDLTKFDLSTQKSQTCSL